MQRKIKGVRNLMSVSYLSDSDPDYICLEEYLKAGGFGDLPDTWLHQAQHDLSSLKETMETLAARTLWLPGELQEELSVFDSIKLPTRYDSPLNFRLLEGLVTRVKSAAERVGLDVRDFPHYSSIPTRRVNACAVNLPCSSRPFLLFDSQLLLFCHLFAKAFARCLPAISSGDSVSLTTNIKEVHARLDSTPDVLDRLIDVLRAYAMTDSPSNAKQYLSESEYAHIVTIIRDGMELFVVAHEFGHVYAGHLNDLLEGTRLNVFNMVQENESHQQEHYADLIGLLLTLHVMKDSGYDAALSCIGIDLFFVSLDMAARYAHLAAGGNDQDFKSPSSVSHPSNQARRSFLKEVLEYIISPPEQLKLVHAISSEYDAIATHLWTRVKQRTHHPAEPVS